MKTVLTIGVSDSSTEAGIQGDLKVFGALGVDAATAITAVEARGMGALRRRVKLPGRIIEAQIDAVTADRDIDAVKIGPLLSWQCVETVAARVRRRRLRNIVLQPGIVAADGERNLGARGAAAVRSRLLPRARLVALSAREAAPLAGEAVGSAEQARALTTWLRAAGAEAVLVWGQEAAPSEPWLLLDDGGATRAVPWVPDDRTGRTGGALTAAIAARLALGEEVAEAVAFAASFVAEAAARASRRGSGSPLLIFPAGADVIVREE